MKKEISETQIAPIESIQSMIRAVGGVQVMLDRDLAVLYGVPVKRLNEQVKRNQDRFPSDFMFQLSKEECLRSQIATLNGKRGEHLKYMPYGTSAIDAAMLQKLLPKLHGSLNRLGPAIDVMLEKFSKKEDDGKDGEKTTPIYPLSHDKLLRMRDRLEANGFTSYAEA